MGSERSSRHLASCTEDPFPPWSWIHPWKHTACEARGLQRREMKISPSQRDNTEFSEAREQTVSFITFICPHSKQTIYSLSPNPNMLFPEFGCNGPQLKTLGRFMIFSWSFFNTTKFIQLCKKFQLHLFGRHLQFTTHSSGDSWVLYQLNRPHSLPWSQVLCRRPGGRQSNGGPRRTEMSQWSLLLQKEAGAALREKLWDMVLGRSPGREKM